MDEKNVEAKSRAVVLVMVGAIELVLIGFASWATHMATTQRVATDTPALGWAVLGGSLGLVAGVLLFTTIMKRD
ncbi:MAG: hypothetical protein U1E26_00480 [Coriobacteriia bacterium]|nr:hypothetical protein [Coriobacteriia bacterium]